MKKSEKKFLKKNLLLQQNLEKFLYWREQRNSDKFNKNSIHFLTIKHQTVQPNFSNLFFSQPLSMDLEKSNYLYKPISGNLSEQLFDLESSTENFFPHKKPFLRFWVFPLLGACFISFLTFDNQKSFFHGPGKFPNMNIFGQTLNNLNFPLNLNNLKTSQKLSKLLMNSNLPMQLSPQMETLLEENEFFSGSYVNHKNLDLKNQLSSKTSLSLEMENLCLLYLNLTNRHIGVTKQNFSLIHPYNQKFFDQILLTPFSFEKSKIDWLWHPLNLTFRTCSLSKNSNHTIELAQKLNAQTNFVDFKNLPNFTSIEIKSKKFTDNPIFSYFKAARLFDNWFKFIALNFENSESEKWINQPNLVSFSTVLENSHNSNLKEVPQINFMSTKNFLNSVKSLSSMEDFISLEFNSKTTLLYHFSKLLKILKKNSENLTKTYSSINEPLNPLKSTKQNDLLLNGENFEKLSTLNSKKNFFKNIQTQYNLVFLKVWLENYLNNSSLEKTNYLPLFQDIKLKQKNLEFDKLILSNEKFLRTFSNILEQKSFFAINSNRFKFFKLNEKLLMDQNAKQKFKKLTLKKMLKNTLFLKLLKPSILKNNNSTEMLKTLKILQDCNGKLKNLQEKQRKIIGMQKKILIEDNSIIELKKEIRNLSYELILLKNWQKLFPKTFVSDKVASLYKTFLENQQNNTGFVSNVAKNQKLENGQNFTQLEKNYTNLTNKKFLKEVQLYCQLNKICGSLRQTELTILNKKEKQINPNPFIQEIVKYKTPILLSNLQNSNFFNADFIPPLKSISNLEINFQQNYPRNLLSLSKLSYSSNNLSRSLKVQEKNLVEKYARKKVEDLKHFWKEKIQKFEQTSMLKNLYLNNLYFNLSKKNFKRMKKFLMVNSFTMDSKQKFITLKSFDLTKRNNSKFNEEVLKRKAFIQYFRRKPNFKSEVFNSFVDNRKPEKIFRAYLSVKKPGLYNFTHLNLKVSSKQNLANISEYKGQSFSFIRPVLRTLKKRVKTKQKNFYFSKNKYLGLYTQSHNFGKNIYMNKSKISIPEKSLGVFGAQTRTISRSSNFLSSTKKFEKFKTFESYVGKQNFQSKTFLRKLGMLNFLKKKDFFKTRFELKLLEKRKAFQKKRRLKKLKLENRRRKKRKRFYPRPHYLRFQLYSSFLEKRHNFKFLKSNVNLSFLSSLSSKHSLNRFEKMKRLKMKISEDKQKQLNFKEKIYRQKKEKWGQFSNNSLFFEKSLLQNTSFMLSKSTYHQKEFYKISNETLAEFERLCWKSYWLRSNLNPYITKIQKNFKRVQELETIKESKNFILNLVKSITKPINTNYLQTRLMKDSTSYKPLKKITPAYLNIKETLEHTGLQNAGFTLFKQLQNKSEYDRLLYNRITDEIKNVKAQLNIDGQNQARSYKVGRQKIEKLSSKNVWNSLNSFQTNYLDPKIPALSFPGNDVSIKSFGDLPTLRLLWACNKTNLFNHRTSNFSQSLWSTYKNREQIKNNKTRKFLSKFFKFSNFLPKNLNDISEIKTRFASKKIQVFGGLIYGKNSNLYLRKLKFQLQMNPVSKLQFLNVLNQTKNLNTLQNPWFATSFSNQPQKRMMHFWWSPNQINPLEKNFPFFLSSPILFSNLDDYLAENKNGFIQTNKFLHNEFFMNRLSLLKSDNFLADFYFTKNVMIVNFWICACLLHLSLFFAVIRIPEIRSLLKFQFLILSKLSNAYLISLFAFYDLLKNYRLKIELLLKKTFSLSKQPIRDKPLGLSIKTIKNTSKTNDYKVFFKEKHSSFDKISLKNQNWKYSVLSNKTNLKMSLQMEKSFLQITVSREFYFRPFFKFIKNHLEGYESLSKKGSLDTIKVLIAAAIPASSRKLNLSVNKVLKEKNWFYSWYTGFLWNTFATQMNTERFLKQKNLSLKQLLKDNSLTKDKVQLIKSSKIPIPQFDSQKNISNKSEAFSFIVQSNVQLQSLLSLLTLSLTKAGISLFYFVFQLVYKILFQIIDILEGILLIFYKFLEKPAELMVTWIAELFLVEWTSDVTTYLPEAFDKEIWTSFFKISRSTRFFSGLEFGFFNQRLTLTSLELIYSSILKADTDLLTRQKKGIIFWDIWAEILIQAAEKYRMNLSSLSTVKEEQELLIENLMEEKSMEPNEKNFSLTTLKVKTSRYFLESDLFKNSFAKLNPLIKFLEIAPNNFSPFLVNTLDIKISNLKNNPVGFFQRTNEFNFFNSIKRETTFPINFSNLPMDSSKRWAVNQYLTTQGRDTDLFMDIHPPKSFSQISFLKTYLPAQEILGSLVCDIYAGLFTHKVSKNILIVGAPGRAKSFFIQALAGETELKIVTDNAHRYAFVNGGVPVGMKLLRDVFDSIALHTPCLFLLEDIHIIGERRPMLISDDETSKAKDLTFGAEQEEVHEKNKLIYQLSRHALSHYKRPYKGDFSLSIPTNHFCYDLFLGIEPSRKRSSDLTTKSPLPLAKIETVLSSGNMVVEKEISQKKSKNSRFLSSLQLSVEQIFAPPATSPFNILLMKEQKKLKPKKPVKEMPWSGLSYDQMMLISKSNYSVRVKVALLAETAINNLSVKLDMITDLLVIIDSVRSNRGFIVFGTTHVPSLLDPALRRPGRFDETISLPLLPNFQSRFEIFKTHLSSYTELMDFVDYSLLTCQTKQNENQISESILKGKLLLLNTKNSTTKKVSEYFKQSNVFSNFFNDYLIYNISQSFQSFMTLESLWIQPLKLKKVVSLVRNSPTKNRLLKQPNETKSYANWSLNNESLTNLLTSNSNKTVFAGHDKLNYLSLSYSQAGQFLIEALIIQDQTTYASKFIVLGSNEIETQNFMFKSLYDSNLQFKQTLLKFFSGKISSFFAFNPISNCLKYNNIKKDSFQTLQVDGKNNKFKNLELYSFNHKNQQEAFAINNSGLNNFYNLAVNPSQSISFENIQNSQNYWQSAILFLDSLFHKRYLYNKNSIVSKMLFFEDKVNFREPPSPPNSSILMPSKKFENYKRTLQDFIQKPLLTINDKLQIHQKQRFLKLLYNVSIQTSFPTVSNQKEKINSSHKIQYTHFYNSFKELGYLDLLTVKPTSSYAFYKNRFLIRQRFSFLNQWWNGQLAEHNVETTYLSHVDWRSMFVESLGDVVIDFPDADQYYNPKSRRWFLQSKSWAYWLDFEKYHREEISQHYILHCFAESSELLNTNREVFDYLAFRFLRYHQLNELDLVQTLIRFYKQKAC